MSAEKGGRRSKSLDPAIRGTNTRTKSFPFWSELIVIVHCGGWLSGWAFKMRGISFGALISRCVQPMRAFHSTWNGEEERFGSANNWIFSRTMPCYQNFIDEQGDKYCKINYFSNSFYSVSLWTFPHSDNNNFWYCKHIDKEAKFRMTNF